MLVMENKLYILEQVRRKAMQVCVTVRFLPLPQFLPQIIFSGRGTADVTWRLTVLHHKRHS